MIHRDDADTSIHDLMDHFASQQTDPNSDFGDVVSRAYNDGREQGFQDCMNKVLDLFAHWTEGPGQQHSVTRKAIPE